MKVDTMGFQNGTELFYPSQTLGGPNMDIEEIITSQNVISRVMHSYLFILVPLGLLAAVFCISILFRNKMKHQTLYNLDVYLLALIVTDITIVLYSFTLKTRPDYLEISNLSCGVLSCFFNVSYYFSQYLLIPTLFILLIMDDSTSQGHLKCIFLTLALSVLMSVINVSLLGTYDKLQNITYCQLDPLNAKPEYDIFKFAVGFGVPSLVLLIFTILLIIQAQREETREKFQSHVVVLGHIVVMFICRLFYNIMLMRRTGIKISGFYISPREELVLNIAELVVFSGSCIRLIVTLVLHKPCREGLKKSVKFLINKCGRKGTPNSVI
ncbi:atypical chemokine receptor 3-like [Dendropsophus ebraccatus]|uniref:atypical chemokine receptor 3-like n=1 Tax=Dendropsophus ebraccatus TaxID=150705 RepID=UPI003832235F